MRSKSGRSLCVEDNVVNAVCTLRRCSMGISAYFSSEHVVRLLRSIRSWSVSLLFSFWWPDSGYSSERTVCVVTFAAGLDESITHATVVRTVARLCADSANNVLSLFVVPRDVTAAAR